MRETNNLRQQNQKLFSLTLSSFARERQFEKLIHLLSLTLFTSSFSIFLRKNPYKICTKTFIDGEKRKRVCVRGKETEKDSRESESGKVGLFTSHHYRPQHFL